MAACAREVIIGGVVKVGADRSEVETGKVERSVIACDAPKMLLATQTASQAAGMVFRSGSIPKSQFTLYGLSPIIEVHGDGTLVIERVDQTGERHIVAIDQQQLLRGAFYDFANVGRTLVAEGVPVPGEAARYSGMKPPTDSEMISPALPR